MGQQLLEDLCTYKVCSDAHYNIEFVFTQYICIGVINDGSFYPVTIFGAVFSYITYFNYRVEFNQLVNFNYETIIKDKLVINGELRHSSIHPPTLFIFFHSFSLFLILLHSCSFSFNYTTSATQHTLSIYILHKILTMQI